ncbi:efflux RND transporter permease subunit [Paenibacillus sp.]|uniref:efflux RND transporter permease subunit n=1 Tax=Paenibacillus sp. TaxID=58172 RepID=UPI002D295C4E|nr:efflux RND transporter permease subunit [Paenibacillus sp.]HZG83547.1 efflux RND transporter permease subunit [Paenibacillus sp.]
MRGIIRFSLNNRFALLIMTVIVSAAGLIAGLNMKQETLPNLEVPYLQVTAVYPGAAPEEIVERVTAPAEQRLRHLPGVLTVNSSSMENVSAITIEYDYGQDMERALAEAREALDGLELPSGAQEPEISRISLNAFPVVSLSVADPSGSLEELTDLVENAFVPALEGLKGVADVQIAGQYVQEAVLEFDQEKLASLGLSEETVRGIVQASAVTVPLGLFELGDEERTIVVDGGIRTLDDLRRLPIPAAGPTGMTTVRLADIATVELRGQSESISRTNGSESIGLQIVKAQEANTVDVVNLVKAEAASLQEQYPDLEIVTLLDQGEPIEKSVATMLEKALFGALFAVVIILLFLRNAKSTLIAVVSIPLSLFIGIVLLQQLEITMNMMTLGAMTVAIGRVVDDSIVVIENIYRRMSSKTETLRGKALILDATREMFIPILSSTIVTIAVFVPLAAVTGMVGELFLPFALTMVFALLASLLVAITVVPSMGYAMFKKGLGRAAADGAHGTEEKPGRLALAYKRALRWTLDHKAVSLLVSVALLVGSLFLVPVIGVSFLPEEEQKYAMVTYTPAPGERLEDVAELSLRAESFFLEDERVENLQYSVGGSNPLNPASSESALFYVQYEDDVAAFAEVKDRLPEELAKAVPGEGEWGLMDFSGGIGGAGLSLNVYGESLEDIRAAVESIRTLMEADGRFENVDSSVGETYGQYTLAIDPERLSRYGVTAGQIAMALRPSLERPVLTSIEAEGNTYEVVVATDPVVYDSIEDIENATVPSPLGVPVRIGDVADTVEGESANAVTRQDGRLYASITADIAARDVAGTSAELEEAIAESLELPNGVDVEFGGVTEQMNDTFSQLGLAMAAAVAIVYLVLVVTFGGGLAPFAILLSLPFAVIGALLALLAAGETISVSAMMGALMLIGIVVTNAIVLIDRVIHKEKEGWSTREALLEAGATRLRPILMTALATIGALLPLAFGNEGSGIISKGLGVAVIGGLASSTLLTLVVVPIAYELLMKLRRNGIEESI